MLRASRARSTHLGLLWILYVYTVDGYIEIVEEQQCHDFGFRLTCRDLDSHIAVLEAWYTSSDSYRENSSQPLSLHLRTENDSELNRVYVYTSPKHNGVYELTNLTYPENATFDVLLNDSLTFNDSAVNVTDSEMGGNGSACGVMTFARSYGSLREGDKTRRQQDWSASINLRAPLSYRLKVHSYSQLGINPASPRLTRCTGVNLCSFVLSEDYPQSVSWSPGVVYIKYACFDDTPSVHYCNREVRVAVSGEDSEGYIRTPGYPNFYVEDECRWRLMAHPEQKIRVILLDVSLRTIGPFDSACKDYVSVQDSNGVSLFSSCEQVDLPLRLVSATNSVDVQVEVRSKGAYPKRGVLFHYKSIGCVTLPAPSDGYLVYRNEDVAHYMCNVNHVFIDTRQRARLIWCYNDNSWNDTVPLCVAEAANPAANDSAPVRDSDAKLPPHDRPDMIVDIVIPSLLIAALFIGNAFIVLIIYKYRKRKNDDIDDEFNTIPLSVNGNVHSAGNAV